MAANSKAVPELAILLPLVDTRDAGREVLQSVLAQTLNRTHYEIIIVYSKTFFDEISLVDEWVSLIQQSDKQITVDIKESTENEVLFVFEGIKHISADLVYIIEGHTIIYPDACASILEHFATQKQSIATWGTRHNRQHSNLGKLIAQHNTALEKQASNKGWFTFGGNSIVRRNFINSNVNISPDYFRYTEAVLEYEIKKHSHHIGHIGKPLCQHINDMNIRHLVTITFSIGRGKYNFFQSNNSNIHPLHELLITTSYLHRFSPLYKATAYTLLFIASKVLVLNKSLAYRAYLWGLGFADIAGFSVEKQRHLSR